MGRVLLMEPLLTAPRLRSLDMPKQGSAEWQAALAVGIPLGLLFLRWRKRRRPQA